LKAKQKTCTNIFEGPAKILATQPEAQELFFLA